MHNCPERMDAADAEAPRPPRIETALEDTCLERMYAEAVLTMRFFWCTRKKRKQKQEAAG